MADIDESELAVKTLMTASYQSVDSPPDPFFDENEPPSPKNFPYFRAGVMHRYRTRFFHEKLVSGQFEQVITVSPNETVEISMEIVRRKTIEEENESSISSAVESEFGTEEEQEFTDKISTVIQRTESSSTSLSVNGSYGVISGGLKASKKYSRSQTDSKEQTKRLLTRTSQRVSQQMSKSYTIRSRRVEEETTRDVFRRLLRNETNSPQHFGLRKIYQNYSAAVQYVGPVLCWEAYIDAPGSFLATPRIVTSDFYPGELLENLTEFIRLHTSQNSTVEYDNTTGKAYLVPVYPYPGERLLRIQFTNSLITSRVSVEGEENGEPWGVTLYLKIEDTPDVSSADGTVRAIVTVEQADVAFGTLPNKIYFQMPELEVLTLDGDVAVASAPGVKEKLSDFLARYRDLISEMRSIRTRPSGELRREEREVLISRMMRSITKPLPASERGNLALRVGESLDLDATFFSIQPPSLNVPRPSSVQRARSYYTHADAPPGRLGASLGWKIQLDGDNRRNEFINSPMAKLSIPIQPGKESSFLRLLSAVSNKTISRELQDILLDIGWRKELESRLSKETSKDEDDVSTDAVSPDLDENTATIDVLAEALFPVIDIFSVNEPLKGFLHEPLDL